MDLTRNRLLYYIYFYFHRSIYFTLILDITTYINKNLYYIEEIKSFCRIFNWDISGNPYSIIRKRFEQIFGVS